MRRFAQGWLFLSAQRMNRAIVEAQTIIDQQNGDLYTATVADKPKSTVLRSKLADH